MKHHGNKNRPLCATEGCLRVAKAPNPAKFCYACFEGVYQQVLRVARREDDEVFAAFRVGSQVYGTATPGSDQDFVLVLKTPVKAGNIARGPGMDVTIKDISSFRESLQQGNVFSMECVFAPTSHVLKHARDFETFKVEEHQHRRRVALSALEKATADYEKGIKINDLKRIYHAFRVLDFAVQIVESGRITDFTSAQKIYETVMTEPRPLETAFQQLFEERCAYLRGQF